MTDTEMLIDFIVLVDHRLLELDEMGKCGEDVDRERKSWLRKRKSAQFRLEDIGLNESGSRMKIL